VQWTQPTSETRIAALFGDRHGESATCAAAAGETKTSTIPFPLFVAQLAAALPSTHTGHSLLDLRLEAAPNHSYETRAGVVDVGMVANLWSPCTATAAAAANKNRARPWEAACMLPPQAVVHRDDIRDQLLGGRYSRMRADMLSGATSAKHARALLGDTSISRDEHTESERWKKELKWTARLRALGGRAIRRELQVQWRADVAGSLRSLYASGAKVDALYSSLSAAFELHCLVGMLAPTSAARCVFYGGDTHAQSIQKRLLRLRSLQPQLVVSRGDTPGTTPKCLRVSDFDWSASFLAAGHKA
jgi:hypothetical protein